MSSWQLSRSCCRPTFNIRLWLRLRANCPSDSGSGSASLHYIRILTWETFQIKKDHSRSRSNRVSLFALEYTWHCSLAFRRRNASENCHVYSNGKSETRVEREWQNLTNAVFLLGMSFSGKWQTETKPIPMKWQPQKPNTKPIFILPKNTNRYLTRC